MGMEYGSELKITGEVESDDDVYVHYDIANYPSDLTLDGIYQMWKQGNITIPDFQREFVWSIKQSSLLIDSFLSGLPVPPVFFYVDPENKNLVIDGQQRILSIVFYFDGFFGVENNQGKRQVFRLHGLGKKNPYLFKQFTELDEASQRKLRYNTVLRAVNIRQIAPPEASTAVYHIFERLNTGGTPLRPQEIRNCVFRGGFAQSLRGLNQDECWRKIIGKSSPEKHQKDVELILRIFSLCKQDHDAYEKPMKEFLNKAMKANVEGRSKKVQYFIEWFSKASARILEQLGEKPFNIRGPLNTSVLDCVFSTVLDNYERLPPDIAERFERLKKDSDFQRSTRFNTSDLVVVRDRFRLAKKFLVG